MSTEEIPSIKDALNDYFRLKEKFEHEINVNKRKIINNPTLSKREKRAEYLKLMPKCVNCKRPSRKGTIFSITFNPSNDKDDSYRVFKSQCGNLADPCNLNIEINLGSFENLDKSIADIKNEIDYAKKNIITDKNTLDSFITDGFNNFKSLKTAIIKNPALGKSLKSELTIARNLLPKTDPSRLLLNARIKDIDAILPKTTKKPVTPKPKTQTPPTLTLDFRTSISSDATALFGKICFFLEIFNVIEIVTQDSSLNFVSKLK